MQFTLDELEDSMKRMKRNKACGIDGISAEMILDGSNLLRQCLLDMFNSMLAGDLPEQLSVGLITTVFKAGGKLDPNNCRGIVVTPVLTKLLAMMLNARIVAFTENHVLRAEAQAEYRPKFKQKIASSSGMNSLHIRNLLAADCTHVLLTSRKHLILYQGMCCGKCCGRSESGGTYLTASRQCMPVTVLQSSPRKG